MSSDQMPAPGKIKLIKFPPPGQEKTSNARGMPGGDVEASIWLIHNIVRINKQRDKSFVFSSILSTVDLSKHLITAWIIRKFIQLVNFVTFRVFFFFFGNRSSMVKPVWAGSFGKWEFIQCRTFYTESVMLGPRFIPESVFYTQSVMLSPRFIPSPCFIPSP